MIKPRGNFTLYELRCGGVTNTLRHYLRVCEIGSTLGPVVEVDVEHIHSKEESKVKVGVRDLHKIPTGTEITTKDLLLYDIGFEFDSVVEQGWYKFEEGNKRKMFEYLDLENFESQRENGMQKKIKQVDTKKQGMNLGHLGLKQYEQMVLKTSEICQTDEVSKKKTKRQLQLQNCKRGKRA